MTIQFLVFLFFSSLLFHSCGSIQEKDKSVVNLDIIPLPDAINSDSTFSEITELKFNAMQLPAIFRPWMESWKFPVKTKDFAPNVQITLDRKLAANSYVLSISVGKIKIKAKDENGLRNALVTILQIAELNNNRLVKCEIQDTYEFEYRGMHLDVCRHFFPVADVKKYIDYLTFYKFNSFHWHLTEDQGWRIEIKEYPKLQEIAAYRDETLIGHYNDQPHKFDGEKYGGFYTQKEVKEIVEYAQNRGVNIIPEIEMPGHSQAALAAYPFLGCEQKDYKVASKWGVFTDVYCPTDETFEFLENVMDEVVELFPYPFIHIGGDECPKESWKNSSFCQELIKEKGLKDEQGLQSYFIGRMANYLKKKNRTIIGWDEILEGGLNEGSIVMSWRGEEGGIAASKQGHKVIMTPGSHCYFDHYQSQNPNEPLAIGGLTTVKDVYNYEIIPKELTAVEAKNVWGAQGNVWSEYLQDFEDVEYMALARMTALSEALFNNIDKRNYIEYQKRLSKHIDHWNAKKVNIADHQLELSVIAELSETQGPVAKITAEYDGAKISFKNPNSPSYSPLPKSDIKLTESGIYSFQASSKKKTGPETTLQFNAHIGQTANVLEMTEPSSYPGSGPTCLLNGVYGNDQKYGGSEWIGISSKDFLYSLEFPENTKIDSVSFRFFKGEGQWIYLPKSVTVYQSADGITYSEAATASDIASEAKTADIVLAADIDAKFLKIEVKNHGTIAEGRQGAGHGAWLFIDEIVLH